jgi:hypothetical protein
MNKEIIKDIYDFVSSENIKSFHCVAFGILPNVTLNQLTSKRTTIDPVLHIILNSAVKTHMNDKYKLSNRFINIPIFYEYYDESLWVEL